MKRAIALGLIGAVAYGGGASAAPKELKLSNFLPERAAQSRQAVAPWIDAMNKALAAAGNEAKVVWYKGNVLGNIRTIYSNLLSGVADIAVMLPTQTRGHHRKLELTALPLISDGDDAEVSSVALWRTHERGVFKDEFDTLHALGLVQLPPMYLLSNKRVTRIEQLKGMKMPTTGKAPMVEALGATPVSVPFTETYQALQKGVVDAAVTLLGGYMTYKFGEVTKFQVNLHVGTTTNAAVISRKAWDGLSKKSREALMSVSGESFSRKFGASYDFVDDVVRKKIKQDGKTVDTLEPGQLAIWKERLIPLNDQIIAGVPGGRHVLDVYTEELAKARKEIGASREMGRSRR